MVPGIHSPMCVYTQVPQPEESHPSNPSLSTAETSPFLPQHKQFSSIQSVPIALAPTILPLTYDPNKKPVARRRFLCQCRGILTWIVVFLLLTVLIHYIVWICLNKDKETSLMDFILH